MDAASLGPVGKGRDKPGNLTCVATLRRLTASYDSMQADSRPSRYCSNVCIGR
jgi:hypothetical protein